MTTSRFALAIPQGLADAVLEALDDASKRARERAIAEIAKLAGIEADEDEGARGLERRLTGWILRAVAQGSDQPIAVPRDLPAYVAAADFYALNDSTYASPAALSMSALFNEFKRSPGSRVVRRVRWAAWGALRLQGRSLNEIADGDPFARPDHTTVLHALTACRDEKRTPKEIRDHDKAERAAAAAMKNKETTT